jgi:hypothetical protein
LTKEDNERFSSAHLSPSASRPFHIAISPHSHAHPANRE